MSRIVLGFLLGALTVFVGAISFVYFEQAHTSAQLRNDIAESDRALSAAKTELANHESGTSLHGLILMRVQILEMTKSLLEQRAASLIYRIRMTRELSSEQPTLGRTTDLARLESDHSESKERIRIAEQRAGEFTGGLLQVTSQINLLAERLTESMINQRLMIARHQMVLPFSTAPVVRTATDLSPSTQVQSSPSQSPSVPGEQRFGLWRLSQHTDRLSDRSWWNAFLQPVEGNRDTMLRIQCNSGLYYMDIFSDSIPRQSPNMRDFVPHIRARIGTMPAFDLPIRADNGSASIYPRQGEIDDFLRRISAETRFIVRIEVPAMNNVREVVYNVSETAALLNRMREICPVRR